MLLKGGGGGGGVGGCALNSHINYIVDHFSEFWWEPCISFVCFFVRLNVSVHADFVMIICNFFKSTFAENYHFYDHAVIDFLCT